jgi:hypothetical protein
MRRGDPRGEDGRQGRAQRARQGLALPPVRPSGTKSAGRSEPQDRKDESGASYPIDVTRRWVGALLGAVLPRGAGEVRRDASLDGAAVEPRPAPRGQLRR